MSKHQTNTAFLLECTQVVCLPTKEETLMLQHLLFWLKATLKREDGQDLAEYALLISLIAVALVLIIGAVAGGIGNIFNAVRNALTVNMMST